MKNILEIIIIISVLVIIGFISVKFTVERQDWLDDHCKKIGEVSSSVGFTTNFNTNGGVGSGQTYIPGKIGYECDDGLTYWE